MPPSTSLLLLLALTIAISSAYPDDTIPIVIITTTATPTGSPTSPKPPSYTSLHLFQDSILSTSNAYRAQHNAAPLVWNHTLSEYARDWAERCGWEHSSGPYGENLAYGYPSPSAAITAWADERLIYDYNLPTGFSEATGHFTQLVWRDTHQVGCAAVDCGYDGVRDGATDGNTGPGRKALGWFVVCEYVPPGNVLVVKDAGGMMDMGLFRVNVQAGGGGASSFTGYGGSTATSTSTSSGTGTATATTTTAAATTTKAHKGGSARVEAGMIQWWWLWVGWAVVMFIQGGCR